MTILWHYHGGCLAGKVVDGDFKVIGNLSSGHIADDG